MLNFNFSVKGLAVVLHHILQMVFQEKWFSCYILLTDQVSLSAFLYFLNYWAICLLPLFVSICLNKNLITHFVWYLEKEKIYDIETCELIEYYIVGTFSWERHAEIMHWKPVQDPFLILVNNPKQPSHTRNCFKNSRYFEKVLSESLKKVNFFFPFKPNLFS